MDGINITGGEVGTKSFIELNAQSGIRSVVYMDAEQGQTKCNSIPSF